MCRNIHTLFNFEPAATDEEVRDAAPPLPRLAELGVARVSYGPYVYRETMQRLARSLSSLATVR